MLSIAFYKFKYTQSKTNMEKDSSITIRVSEKTKKKLNKMAVDNRREFSDFVRLILTDVADEKIKITI